jgi:CRP/FNR family cyclic AMP-dependent transcriptional regulator|tara:strand:- start:708 stop:1067 length:360 start_codon:yes stop_codon:yes gene_type:complete
MSKTVYFKKDQVILKEGELSFEAYIIDEGEVEVQKAGYGYLTTLKKNEVFGEIGWLERTPRTATCKATSDRVVLRVLKEEEAVKFIKNNPKALVPLLRALSSKLRGTLELIEKFTNSKE